MGPVWVDMFYTWQADGRLSPDLKLSLIGPGMPGQPMYYVVPAKAAQQGAGREVRGAGDQPEVQADGIVKKFNWYPGIDAQVCQAEARRGDLGQALRRRHARGSGEQGQALPDHASTSTTSSRPTSARSRTDAERRPTGAARLPRSAPAGERAARRPAPRPAGAGDRFSCFSSIRWGSRRSMPSPIRRAAGRSANFAKALELYRTDILFTPLIVALATADRRPALGRDRRLPDARRERPAVAALRWLYRWPLFIPFIVGGPDHALVPRQERADEQCPGRPPAC